MDNEATDEKKTSNIESGQQSQSRKDRNKKRRYPADAKQFDRLARTEKVEQNGALSDVQIWFLADMEIMTNQIHNSADDGIFDER